MQKLLKNIVRFTYKPMLDRYLAGTTTYTYKKIQLEIPPEVFHPGFFFSTRLLLRHLANLPVAGKQFLELGAGSGLISIVAAKKGAQVTASDINTIAIAALKENARRNKVKLNIVQSDLFQAIPRQKFDLIAINPPYYKKNPGTEKEYAWYCGERGEFFQRLFQELQNFIHTKTVVMMILCDGCDQQMILTYARYYNFTMKCIATHKNLIERNFIYKIEKMDE
jgi:release factor glutamine methyltransferase